MSVESCRSSCWGVVGEPISSLASVATATDVTRLDSVCASSSVVRNAAVKLVNAGLTKTPVLAEYTGVRDYELRIQDRRGDDGQRHEQDEPLPPGEERDEISHTRGSFGTGFRCSYHPRLQRCPTYQVDVP